MYWGKTGCICAKADIFDKKWLYSGKVVVFGQKRFYSGASGSIRVKEVAFGQGGCIRAKWLYSGKMVISGQK